MNARARAAAALLLALLASPAAGDFPRLPPDQTSYGGQFTLHDHHGAPFTEQDLRGGYALLYFGYTHCPDACPTALAKIAGTLRLLGPRGARVRPLFVDVDPAATPLAELAEYVGYFHPRLTGLTGDAAQVRAAADAYRVYYTIAEIDGRRTVSHAGFIFLVGPDGRVLTYFPHGAEPAEMAAAIEALVTATD